MPSGILVLLFTAIKNKLMRVTLMIQMANIPPRTQDIFFCQQPLLATTKASQKQLTPTPKQA